MFAGCLLRARDHNSLTYGGLDFACVIIYSEFTTVRHRCEVLNVLAIMLRKFEIFISHFYHYLDLYVIYSVQEPAELSLWQAMI